MPRCSLFYIPLWLQNPHVATSSATLLDQTSALASECLEKLTTGLNSNTKTTGGTMESQSFTFVSRLRDTASSADPGGDDITVALVENAQGDDKDFVSYTGRC